MSTQESEYEPYIKLTYQYITFDINDENLFVKNETYIEIIINEDGKLVEYTTHIRIIDI